MSNEAPSDPDGRATLFVQFHDFWVELNRLEADIAGGGVDAPAARARLRDFVKAQQSASAKSAAPPIARDAYREAQYVMAAVADDMLVQLPWAGAGEWAMHPLELELFGSRCSGQQIFDRIDALLAGHRADASEMAGVYLAALAFGFTGMYADRADGERAIAEYRFQLGARVGAGNFDGPLVSQCYADLLELSPGGLLPSARAWWWAAAVVVGGWLVVSSLLWRQLSGVGS
jgi:type VI secretion system protein ImpK